MILIFEILMSWVLVYLNVCKGILISVKIQPKYAKLPTLIICLESINT